MYTRLVSNVLGTLTFICVVLAMYSFINPPIRMQVVSGQASCFGCTDVITENVKDTSVAVKYAAAAVITGLPLTAIWVYRRQKQGKNRSESQILIVDFFGLGTALLYLLLILPFTFSANWRISNRTEAIVESRIIPVLIIAIGLAGYSWYARRRPSRFIIATLLILIVTSVAWHFGVRVY